MTEKKRNKPTYSEDFEPIEDALGDMCRELIQCIGAKEDTERKNKLALGIFKTLSYRLRQGEDLPHPLKHIPKKQWLNSTLISDIQMLAICNDILLTLDQRGAYGRD